jgi:DNA-binding MarR family transcriptional regulator
MSADFALDLFLPYRLAHASERISLEFAQHYKRRYQMTRPEWRTLAALGSVGPMTATEIGVHSKMHKTKVSRAVRALELRRWLKRTQSETDRRVEQIELTALGRKCYLELTHLAERYQESLIRSLGKQTVQKLEAALSAIEALPEKGLLAVD